MWLARNRKSRSKSVSHVPESIDLICVKGFNLGSNFVGRFVLMFEVINNKTNKSVFFNGHIGYVFKAES